MIHETGMGVGMWTPNRVRWDAISSRVEQDVIVNEDISSVCVVGTGEKHDCDIGRLPNQLSCQTMMAGKHVQVV